MNPERPPSYADVPRAIVVLDDKGVQSLVLPHRFTLLKYSEKRLMLFTDDGRVFYGQTSIASVMEAFPGVWLRTNRRFAIRRESIAFIQRQRAVLSNGDGIPISRRQYDAVMRQAFSATRTMGRFRDAFDE